MDEENEVGREVRENHAKLRNFLVSPDLESICVDNFCQIASRFTQVKVL